MSVHWTPEAKAQLKAIEDYLAKNSPGIAKRTLARLAGRCRQIGELPRAGRKVPEFNRDDLREVLEAPYRIVYRIKSGQIHIVTLWHYRRPLPREAIQH